ncbi:MAG: polyhydroxyalkanoate synthesis repressor PhaR [Betaproteobacteria bacterium]|nr:polyhydroxyalkanoate synthesis repressor PhaR [Betaproteobacteria bacterium]
MAKKPSAERIIKKYPNRRLYDTDSSGYITLADVKQLVIQNEPFKVQDAKTGDDLTRSILLQIILEEEAAGQPLFSEMVLAQIIRFYGNAMQGVMGSMIEKNVQAFVDMQARMAEQSRQFLDPKAYSAESWAQLMKAQNPMLQNMMSSYMEQSKDAFAKMQEQMQEQAQKLAQAFGGKR